MYCKYCGKQIDDKAVVCVYCGVPTDNYAAPQPVQQQTATNVLAIIGFILSFFVAIAGLICSIIAYKNAPKYGGNGKSFALAGIIISIIEIVLVFFIVIIYVLVILSLLGALAA